MVTFFSLILFFGIMGYCESSYENKDLDLLGSFEKNVCLNKKGILGGIIDEELLADKPLSFDLTQICSNLKAKNPTKQEIINGF